MSRLCCKCGSKIERGYKCEDCKITVRVKESYVDSNDIKTIPLVRSNATIERLNREHYDEIEKKNQEIHMLEQALQLGKGRKFEIKLSDEQKKDILSEMEKCLTLKLICIIN